MWWLFFPLTLIHLTQPDSIFEQEIHMPTVEYQHTEKHMFMGL